MKFLNALKMTGLTLALLMTVQVSQATIISNTFEAEVMDGPFTGTTGTGSWEYDDSFLVAGDESLGPVGGSGEESDHEGLMALSFTILGQTFDIEDDEEFPDFPVLEFLDSIPDKLDFLILDLDPIDIQEPGVTRIAIEHFQLVPFFICQPECSLDFFVAAAIEIKTPEPGTLALIGLGLISFALRKRS